MVSGISTAGQTQTQINLLTDLRRRLTELERQVVTGKATDTFSGLSADAQRVQSLRGDSSELNSFIEGSLRATTRTQLMLTSMERMDLSAKDVASMFILQVQEGDIEIDDINRVASDRLDFIQSLMNTESEGRFLFAGTDVGTAPMASPNNLDNTIANMVDDWITRTITTDQFLSDLQALNDGQLGYSATLDSAGVVTARADENLEVDYTAKANETGMREIMIAVALAKHLRVPPTDVGTAGDQDISALATLDAHPDINAGDQFTIQVGDGDPETITINAGDTANDLVAQINGLTANITASINGAGQLVLEAPEEFRLDDISLGIPGIQALGLDFVPYDTPLVDFFRVFREIPRMLDQGRTDLEQKQFDIGTAHGILDRTINEHKYDISTLDGLVAEIENVDMTETITKLQILETQLIASFETSSIVSRLSLVNFI